MLIENDVNSVTKTALNIAQTRREKMLSFEWLGQTGASLCWIISVFVYGFSKGDQLELSTGDWLQLMAASCWMLSNIASVISIKR